MSTMLEFWAKREIILLVLSSRRKICLVSFSKWTVGGCKQTGKQLLNSGCGYRQLIRNSRPHQLYHLEPGQSGFFRAFWVFH